MASGGDINTDILSDETFDLLCTVCTRKGRNGEAEHFCIDCQEYYCSGCVKVHKDIPLPSEHKVLDQGQFPSISSQRRPAQPRDQESSQAMQLTPTEGCDRHSHYFIDTYCQNHDMVGCSMCMAVDHRSCQGIFYIPEFVENNASETTNEFKKILESTAKALTECHENFQRQKQELLKEKDELLANIRKFRKEINDRLDELEKTSVDEIKDKYNALINQIEKAKTKLQKNRTQVSSTSEKLASAGQNASQTFVNAKRGRQIVTDAFKCINEEKVRKCEGNVEFTGDRKLISLLEQMDALGGVTCVNEMNAQHLKDVRRQSTLRPVTRKSDSSGKLNKSTLLQIQDKKVYSIKTVSDRSDCNIVSACTLEDGTIILSDNSNKKLKRLDSTTYTVTDYCDLPACPWQVCVINEQEAAVCLNDKKGIHLISLSGRMKTTKKIKPGVKCYGLAYAEGNLYISDCSESVYIYSILGQNLKQFRNDQSGRKCFSNVRQLAVSEYGLLIYVVDSKEGLIVMNDNGQVVSTFSGPQLRCGTGCYLTRTGELLVCGYSSRNVLQFGYRGELVGQVYKSEMYASYQAVCCDQKRNKMILCKYNNNNFEVYDLK